MIENMKQFHSIIFYSYLYLVYQPPETRAIRRYSSQLNHNLASVVVQTICTLQKTHPYPKELRGWNWLAGGSSSGNTIRSEGSTQSKDSSMARHTTNTPDSTMSKGTLSKRLIHHKNPKHWVNNNLEHRIHLIHRSRTRRTIRWVSDPFELSPIHKALRLL